MDVPAHGPNLVQRKLIDRREVSVDEFTVRYRRVDLRRDRERSIPTEELIVEQAARGNRLDGLSFGLAVLFLFFMVLALQQGKDPRNGPNLGWGVFWALAGFASGLGCWMRSGRYVLIPVAGQEPIDIYGDVPDASATEAFLAELQDHVRSYARGKYGRISEAMPVDQQMHRLTWLRDRNFITDAEYHADSIRLEAMLKKPPDNPIGFRR